MPTHTAPIESALTPEQAVLTDHIGNEVYASHYAERKAYRLIIICETVLLCGSIWSSWSLAHRPVVNRYVRIDEMGRAQAIQYTDLNYSPREGEVRTYLTDWANYRYTIGRDTIAKKYPLNYYFLSQIRYGSKGSDELGISPNTYGTVTGVDAGKNLITVTGADDSPRVYNPATEWQMRLKATVYSPEERELAVGERVQLTRSEWDQGIRVGHLATIEHIHEDGGLSIKVDSGASLQLTPEQAQHIEYGYAIESTKRLAVDRVILSGEAEQITAQREALSQLPANLHELTVYTSDGYQATSPEIAVQKESAIPAVAEISAPEIQGPSIELEGYAIEM